MATFKCEYCEEMYDISLRFKVEIVWTEKNQDEESKVVLCPDCISNLFSETPEDFIEMKVDRCIN